MSPIVRKKTQPWSLLWMILILLVHFTDSKYVPYDKAPDIQRSMDNYWRFDFSTGFNDTITKTPARLHGNHSSISINGSRDHNGYLFIKDRSSVQLHGFKYSCFSSPFTCVSGVSIAIWLRVSTKDQATCYIMSKTGAFSLVRSSKYSLVVRIVNATIVYESRFKVNMSIWNHIAFTWDKITGLLIYRNSRKLNTKTYGIIHHQSPLTQNPLRDSKNDSLFLSGRGSFDDVMVWHKTLSLVDIKKIFQAQINSIFNASCEPGVTSLNISWQHSRDIYNTIASYYVRLRTGKNSRKIDGYKLAKTATNVVFENLLPMTSYRTKIWAETEDEDIIKTEVVRCQTKEGEPERVINFKATPTTSSSVFIQWIPPARINGLLKGYQVSVSNQFLNRKYFIYGKQSYLIQRLPEDSTFDITIAAVNGRGPGWPSSVTVRTKEIPIITAKPNGLQAIATDWNKIQVTWLPIDPGMEVEAYEIRVCKNTNCSTTHSKRTSVSIEGLDQDAGYRIKVRGKNRRSRGPWNILPQLIYTLDLDECEAKVHSCSRYSSCYNTRGSYICICFPGYHGNGTTCAMDSTKTSACDFETIEDLSWQWTEVGQQARVLCPQGTQGVAERFCGLKDEKPTWGEPNLEGCVSERILTIQNRLKTEHINEETITDISNKLAQATNLTKGLAMYGGDVTAIVKIIKTMDGITARNATRMDAQSRRQFSEDHTSRHRVLNRRMAARSIYGYAGDFGPDTAIRDLQLIRKLGKSRKGENIVMVASNILDAMNMKSWKQIPVDPRMSDASQLMASLDSIIMATISLLPDMNPVTQSASNVVVNMQSFLFNQLSGYVQYPLASLDSTSIALPLDDVKPVNIKRGNQTNVSFIYFKNIGLLLTERSSFNHENKTENKEKQSVSPEVLSLSTSPKPAKVFRKPVIITLKNPSHEEGMDPLCVYWNRSAGHTGSWSSHGCLVNFTNTSHTVCHCNHLTSFSVLMQHSPVTDYVSHDNHHFALSMITFICIGISSVALFLALITFMGCTFLKSTRNFAHINLTLSLLLAEVLFLAGIDKTQHVLPCRIIAIFLHYLFLVVFCWMASEGIILYFMLVRVFPSETSGPRKKMFFIFSWGLPCVFVGFTSSFYFQGYGNHNYCWLSIDDGFIWSFLAPVLLVSLVNLVFLAMTFKAMANRSTPHSANKKKTFKHWIKACAVLTCLLGTTWLFGLFYVNKNTLVMAYLFNIFNSLQGLLVFIFHCVFDERVRSEYFRILCCRGSRRDRLRQKSTNTLTFRKLTSASSGQIRKFHQSLTDGKVTNSGSIAFAKNDLESSQNGIADTFDSDSLLTINKTSAEEQYTTDDQDATNHAVLKTPAVDICSDTEPDDPDYNQQKEQSWGEQLTGSLFNVSSLEEWESRSSKRISRPLSEDTSGLSMPRSKDYYSDGDYNRYTTDLSDIYQSENGIGSHPVIQTEEGMVVKLGRCRICSNDSYQMMCVHDEDNLTQASFDCAEESPSLQLQSTTDASNSSGVTVPSARISFDDSILTGFLRDEHPNPKIISHRWTHIPYIKKSHQMPKKNFMTESTSCDDRFLRSPEGSPLKKINSSKKSLHKLPSEKTLCSRNSLDKESKKKENSQTELDLNKFDKPIGMVAPMMAPLAVEQQEEEEDTTPHVALAESIDELRNEEDNGSHDTLKNVPTNEIITSKTPDGKYKTSIKLNIATQPTKTEQENNELQCLSDDMNQNIPKTHNVRKNSDARLPIYPHATTATRKEMSSIKQGIVQKLGQVFESGWQMLHPDNGEQEVQKKTDNENKRTKIIEKKAQPVPGNVRNLREMFETRPVLDNAEC